MEQPESIHQSDETADARLSGQLQQLQSPSPGGLEQATRGRIEQYMRRRRIVQAVVIMFCFVTAVVAMRWLVPNEDKAPKIAQTESLPLDDRELTALFSPPPVDPLALLDRHQQVSYQALKQWERNR